MKLWGRMGAPQAGWALSLRGWHRWSPEGCCLANPCPFHFLVNYYLLGQNSIQGAGALMSPHSFFQGHTGPARSSTQCPRALYFTGGGGALQSPKNQGVSTPVPCMEESSPSPGEDPGVLPPFRSCTHPDSISLEASIGCSFSYTLPTLASKFSYRTWDSRGHKISLVDHSLTPGRLKSYSPWTTVEKKTQRLNMAQKTQKEQHLVDFHGLR